MNRVNFFMNILKRCEGALKNDPSMIPLEWIIPQLNYLIGLENGQIKDCSRLAEIKIDRIAAREMDGYQDKELIQALCAISLEVNKMLIERGQIK